jgi:hypothetical protein
MTSKFNKILYEYRDKLSISFCPENITTEMLYVEMNGSKDDYIYSDYYFNKNNRNALWEAYYIVVILQGNYSPPLQKQIKPTFIRNNSVSSIKNKTKPNFIRNKSVSLIKNKTKHSNSQKKLTKTNKSRKNKSRMPINIYKSISQHGGQVTFDTGLNTLTQLIIPGYNVFGSSLPTQRRPLLNSFFNLYQRYGIKDIISLQACGNTAVNTTGCNPLNPDIEKTTWILHPYYGGFIDFPFKDMTAGTEYLWYNFGNLIKNHYKSVTITPQSVLKTILTNAINRVTVPLRLQYQVVDTDPRTDKGLLIHCLAGYGRTGAALLYMLLYFIFNNMNHQERIYYLTTPYFGMNKRMRFYNMLINLLFNNIKIPDSRGYDDVLHNNGFQPVFIINELFNVNSIHRYYLFIQRINFIFYILAQTFSIPTVCKYDNTGKVFSSYNIVNVTILQMQSPIIPVPSLTSLPSRVIPDPSLTSVPSRVIPDPPFTSVSSPPLSEVSPIPSTLLTRRRVTSPPSPPLSEVLPVPSSQVTSVSPNQFILEL